jgi:hypothetical protein
MSRIARAAAAWLGIAVLGGGLVLPALGLVLAVEPAAFCCAKGRCCCADPAAGADERPCLRRGCGCETRDAVVAGAPPWLEAVLPAASRLARPEPRPLERGPAPRSPRARPHAPPVPPPRRSLHA